MLATHIPKARGRFAEWSTLVTGAAGGIGSAVARRLADEGALVAVTDVDADAAEFVAEEIRRAGGRAQAFGLDVSDPACVESVFDAAENALGALRVFAHVAAVFDAQPLLATPDDDVERFLSVNVRGAFHCLRAAGRRMAERRAGAIVTVASQSAKVIRKDQSLYGATKAASSYLTKALGLELAAQGVRCNVVHPGVTATPMSRRIWSAGRGSAEAHVRGNLDRFRVGIPLQKVAAADEVAAAVAFLASDDARHITMQDIVVDGGSALIA